MKFNSDKILLFHNFYSQDSFNRFNSWSHCYNAFDDFNKSEDLLALHLGFYLASWGMYRGSTGLLQKDYQIHIEAVSIIKNYNDLRCSMSKEINRGQIDQLISLKEDLFNYYNQFRYFDGKSEFKEKKPTETLLSKIILGTLGCSPAFDRYFNIGVKVYNKNALTFNEKTFNILFDFIEQNDEDILELQEILMNKENVYYPKFKLVDMFFWQLGFNKELKK